MQKIIFSILFAFILIEPCFGQVAVTIAEACTANRTKSVSCNNSNNCNATGIIICYGIGIGDAIACPEGQQYCAKDDRGDSCSSSVPSECRAPGSQQNDFTCTDFGYFPNVVNCTSYYFCGLNEAGDGFESTEISCPSGNVFDPNSASFCTRRSIFNNCVTYSCPNVSSLTYGQLSYGQNRQYFALCIPGDLDHPRIFSCPSNTLPTLSKFPATCDYRCLRVGVFENTSDKTKYFECFMNNQLRLESAARSCPPRSEFNPSRSRCEAIIRSLSEDIDF